MTVDNPYVISNSYVNQRMVFPYGQLNTVYEDVGGSGLAVGIILYLHGFPAN